MLKIDPKKVDQNIKRSQEYLFSRQHGDGYWAGLLEADVSVVSGFIPLIRFLGIKNREREKKAVNYLLEKQNQNGSWSLFWKGSGSIDVTIQTYFGLKICGLKEDQECMKKARKFVLDSGGIEAANTYTKIILALFGQYRWDAIPEIPPEIIFLPEWFFINIYDFASWTRSTIMAFSIIISLKPVYKLREDEQVFELYRDMDNFENPKPYKEKNIYSLGNLFLILNRAFKLWDKLPRKVKIGRDRAIKKVEKWIVQRQEDDGSWGGIMLPWLFSLIALKCLGYENTHPVMKKGLEGLEDFIAEDSNKIVLQPATSPVWDTAWVAIALRESGIPENEERLVKAANWLLEKQVRTKGDWSIKNPWTDTGCWSFEFENKFYPDIDDTSIVCLALSMIGAGDEKRKKKAIRKGINWVLDMQNSDGSWAAFDRDNDKKILRHIPFADFITPLDFGSPDITGHVLSVLGKLGYFDNIKAITKALNYLKTSQEKDGSWYGRWGVNYIYGTSKVLQAIEEIGENVDSDLSAEVKKAAAWFKRHQNEDGGWGESCVSYENYRYEHLGESTASQTAWAILALLAAEGISSSVARGINYLTGTQKPDGSWDEKYYTGGGFPGAFYLKYELYKDYFPLMALAKFNKYNIRCDKNGTKKYQAENKE
ncbi:MAG: squalene--hopene cyclase [Candidatus Humimicrobiaceae bacterium]